MTHDFAWKNYGGLLIPNEKIELTLKVIRDVYMFTDKRLVLIDIQGSSGKNTSYQSIPYNRISSYAVQTAGAMEFDSEFVIWVSGMATPIVKKVGKSVNVFDLQQVLSRYVLIG